MNRRYPWKVYQTGFFAGFGKAAILSFLFYRDILIACLAGIGFGSYRMFSAGKDYRRQQICEITFQFREGLQGIAAALGAGYSIENAFQEAQKDLLLLYGADALLVKEFRWIGQQLSLNRPIEDVLFAFADRWKSEDILHFAQVFQTAKRTGGNLISITRSTAEKISEKIEVEREIAAMLAGKKMEGKIMNGIPLGIILYFWICSPGFLDCMYRASGRIVMTILLVFYLFAYKWSEHIGNIQI